LIFPSVDETFNCSDVKAYVASSSGVFTSMEEKVNFAGTIGTCQVNWNGLFKTTDGVDNPVGDMSVGLLVAVDQATPAGIAIIVPDKTSKIKAKFEMEQSLYLQDVLRADATDSNKVTLTSVLSLNRYTEPECELPTSVVFMMPGCSVNSTEVDTSCDFKNTFTYTLDQKDITECAGSLSIEGVVNTVNYEFQVSTDAIKEPSSVDSTRQVVDSISNQPIDFNVTMKMGDIPNGTITLDKVLMEINEYSNERCDGMLYPASRVVVTVKASSSRDNFTPGQVADGSVYFDDSQLVRNETWCDSVPSGGAYKTCYFKYKSEECFPMTVENDTCTFAYLGFFKFQMDYDYVEEVKNISRSFLFNEPVINDRTFEGEQCPRVAEQEDVTITTPVELLLESLDFNSDLKATLRFTELNDDSQVTLRIVSIEASIVGTNIMRTFNVDEKLKLMSYEASPYYIDGHFCRFAETIISSCNPFYSQKNSDFTSLDPALFGVANKGYAEC